MTDVDVEKMVELRDLIAKADVLPLAYRPNEFDDWGTIRGGGIAFEPDHRHFIASVRDSRVDHDVYPEHRKAGTDPYEAVTRLFVDGLNALPALLDTIEALAREKEQMREALESQIRSFEMLAPRAGFTSADIADCTAQARAALSPTNEGGSK